MTWFGYNIKCLNKGWRGLNIILGVSIKVGKDGDIILSVSVKVGKVGYI